MALQDNPVFPLMQEASARVVGATLVAGVAQADDLPAAWVERAQDEAGPGVPTRLGHPPLRAQGGDPDAERHTVERIRSLVSPVHGLR